MLNGYWIIDADGHVMEPPDLWERRLEPEFRDQAPKTVGRFHYYGDLYWPYKLDESVAAHFGQKTQEYYKKYLEAGWSPASQVAAMDDLGLDVSYLFPTQGLYMWHYDGMEPRLAQAIARAYNNWLHEFCAYDPKRLKPVAGLSLHSPEEALSEVRRVAKLGFHAVFLRPNPVNGRLLSDVAYEPIWAECEAANLAVCLHEGAHGPLPTAGLDRFKTDFAIQSCSHPLEQMMALLALLEGGVLERHPDLHLAFLESGCGWLPFWLWRLDERWENVWFEVAETVTMKPSAYFRRQCWIAAEPEPYLGDIVKWIGEDRILFASDYPHGDHKPEITRDIIALEDLVTRPVLEKILEHNPRAFYREG